ncbi:DUF6133 family protein [Sinanaerobacter chloroacetimidivorans]|uniref:Uncharacterized protein n=1 Tax=Sinanaerobacter chloroacetimidivorans TaxID=2818044 RepID=A0A8J7W1U0_9FIRM|nr:DUF6133 family protein [Sinanaerobacter chloroacetimidivorans]MBR0597660.1 hypothetical protein [Sinanaerobacter chloroacetimidivorans]
MIRFLKRIKDRMVSRIGAAISFAVPVFSGAKIVLADNRAEGYVDTAIKILMSVVIGALILAGLYALFGDTVLPTLTERIEDMFNYGG